MTDKERKYLSDILISIDHVIAFTKDISSFDHYKGNFLVKAAVERHLGIIGEAVNKLFKESPQDQLTNASQIISVRNRLIHAYDNIDDRIIWTIVKRHVGPLREEVSLKLEKSK